MITEKNVVDGESLFKKITPLLITLVLSLLFEFSGLWFVSAFAGLAGGVYSSSFLVMAASTVLGALIAYLIAIFYILSMAGSSELLDSISSIVGVDPPLLLAISVILAVAYVFLGGCVGYFTKRAFRGE